MLGKRQLIAETNNSKEEKKQKKPADDIAALQGEKKKLGIELSSINIAIAHFYEQIESLRIIDGSAYTLPLIDEKMKAYVDILKSLNDSIFCLRGQMISAGKKDNLQSIIKFEKHFDTIFNNMLNLKTRYTQLANCTKMLKNENNKYAKKKARLYEVETRLSSYQKQIDFDLSKDVSKETTLPTPVQRPSYPTGPVHKELKVFYKNRSAMFTTAGIKAAEQVETQAPKQELKKEECANRPNERSFTEIENILSIKELEDLLESFPQHFPSPELGGVGDVSSPDSNALQESLEYQAPRLSPRR